jgi:hypothetical protein
MRCTVRTDRWEHLAIVSSDGQATQVSMLAWSVKTAATAIVDARMRSSTESHRRCCQVNFV